MDITIVSVESIICGGLNDFYVSIVVGVESNSSEMTLSDGH